ncbi:DNA -binding domain-containing protein [Lichenicoccus sp.]|uniref:DNA -binding domain-containing protein n=1 Tax=Lichenicoccus sp. TaxID=2781899 RepID=UPI003D0D0A3F
MPSLGGCDFLEDPALDARIAEPFWHPEPDPFVALGPAVTDGAASFSLWAIPGPKSLVHDGRRLLMRTTLGRRVVRLAVALTLNDGAPFAYAVPAGLRNRRGMKAAADLDAALAGAPLDSRASAVPRNAIVHMRSLQALDAERDGLSERAIAELIFGTVGDPLSWNDSALRANVRYLLDHGRAYRDGGYCDLIHPKPPKSKAAKP